MKKYKYIINNLDCANCAREIEEGLNKDKRLCNVHVNFSTSKISYETTHNISLKELNELVKKIEPESFITQEDINTETDFNIIIFIIALIIFVISIFINNKIINNMLLIITYILLLYKIIIKTIKILINNHSIDANFLISISCIGAFLIGSKAEGIIVITLYTIGKLLEHYAINKSRSSIKNIIDLKVKNVQIKEGTSYKDISVEEVNIGDVVLVKKGARVPIDGIIKKDSTFDTSSITGESEYVKIKKGKSVFSGYINIGDTIELEVTSLYQDSMIARILDIMEDATEKKAKTENLVSKWSKIYTPVIISLSLILFLLLSIIGNLSFKDSLYRSLTFLVISCPCAIVISIPLSYFSGLGIASKNGILIKGSNYLDQICSLKKIIFDKTGTLTTGTFNVENIEIIDTNYDRDKIIELLRMGESKSPHPIAKSIMNLSNKKIDETKIKDYHEEIGHGISYRINNKKVFIGSKKMCNCDYDTDLHLNVNGKHIASITINDGLKDGVKETINYLNNQKIKTYMFTGDKNNVAKAIAESLNISAYQSEMLPEDKYNYYEKVSSNMLTAFVGDGINDAPTLKRADIGISMGNVGSESAIEASDIVIMNDDIKKISLLFEISKYTKKIIIENLIFSLSIKVLTLILGSIGIVSMWLAVLADTGVTLITVINSLRIIKKYNNIQNKNSCVT